MHWWIIVFASLSLACSQKAEPSEVQPEPEPEVASPTTESAKEDSPPEPTDQPSKTEAAAGLSIGDPPRIDLIDAGNEPRRELSWNIKQRSEQEISIKTTGLSEAVLGGWLPAESRQPPIVYELVVKTKDVEPGKPAHIVFRIERATADLSETPKKLKAGIRKAARTLQGTRGS
jgi:hypothetical protein